MVDCHLRKRAPGGAGLAYTVPMSANTGPSVLVTGGGGYVGSVLVPRLLGAKYSVTVLDRFFFGRQPVSLDHPKLELVTADIRDQAAVESVLSRGRFDSVIHLACVSNDPSSEIDPEITRAINRVALEELMLAAKRHRVARFIYASSSSVYGIKQEAEVHEDLPLEPLTLYARYKAEGEEVLNRLCDPSFTGVSVRSATVCGYSPRLRLDLTVNILTSQALRNGRITVFGGTQMRPNIHVEDVADFYTLLLDAPADRIQGRAFNVCHSNATVMGLAEMVRSQIHPALPIEVTKTTDLRSYRVSGGRAQRELGYAPKRSLEQAVASLKTVFDKGSIADPTDIVYRNVEAMKAHRDEWVRASASPAGGQP
jgi:nucleoside-diphosphate-sugar epimerase